MNNKDGYQNIKPIIMSFKIILKKENFLKKKYQYLIKKYYHLHSFREINLNYKEIVILILEI